MCVVLVIGSVCVPSWNLLRPLMVQKNRSPNILFLLTDDQRRDTLGCMDNAVVRTPEIDRLARAGGLFQIAFVTTSACSPIKTCIVTGQYARHRIIGDLQKRITPDPWSATYPARLRSSGYCTGHIGTWDVGDFTCNVRKRTYSAAEQRCASLAKRLIL